MSSFLYSVPENFVASIIGLENTTVSKLLTEHREKFVQTSNVTPVILT